MSQPSPTDEVHALLEQALDAPPSSRQALLDRACAGRPELRERLERLLRRSAGEAGFLDRAALREDVARAAGEAGEEAGRIVGAYRLTRLLGRGGMAEVWLGERNEGGFHQRAALKLIPRASGSLGQRFALERDILAGLTHPRIARLYDGGVAADGSAYMVMEYVEGEHLMAYARSHALDLGERLDLFLQVCDAVAYAHTQLVVHRDLKPSNILVDAEGNATLLDFGIARLLDAPDGGDSTRTIYFSPSYAAPEQVAGEAAGTATDVHALGVILFELLTGQLPWPAQAPMATVVQRLMDAPTPLPSRHVGGDAPIGARALRGDLDAIVAKALRREPEQRYPDARALADDIRRYLAHRPVQARSGARAYVTRRFLRRNWLPMSIAAVMFAALLALTTAAVWQARQARIQAQRAESVQGFLLDLFRTNSSRQADPVKARQTTARELLDIGAKRIDTTLADAPQAKLELLDAFATLYRELMLPDEQVQMRRQAVALNRTLHGDHSVELAESLVDLAEPLIDSSASVEVEPVLAEASAILDGVDDPPPVLRGRLLLKTAALYSKSDVPRAHAAAAQAIAHFEQIPDSVLLIEAYYVRGLLDLSLHEADAAVEALRRTVELSRRLRGPSNPELPGYYYRLAWAERNAMNYPQAEAAARQSLALSLAMNGEDHADVLRARSMLAVVLWSQDRIKEGLELALQAKAAATRVFGDHDPLQMLGILGIVGRIEVAAGDWEAGLADLQAALELARKQQAWPHAANMLQEIAGVLPELGRADEATAALDELRAIRERIKQPLGSPVALAQARIDLDLGHADKARAMLDGFEPSRETPSATMVDLARRDLLAAELALQLGDATKAAALAADVGTRLRASALAPHVVSILADSDLHAGRALLSGGDATAARALLARAFDTRAGLYLPQAAKIAEAQLALAECEVALGRRDEAQRLFDEALAIQARHGALAPRYTEPSRRMGHLLAQR